METLSLKYTRTERKEEKKTLTPERVKGQNVNDEWTGRTFKL